MIGLIIPRLPKAVIEISHFQTQLVFDMPRTTRKQTVLVESVTLSPIGGVQS